MGDSHNTHVPDSEGAVVDSNVTHDRLDDLMSAIEQLAKRFDKIEESQRKTEDFHQEFLDYKGQSEKWRREMEREFATVKVDAAIGRQSTLRQSGVDPYPRGNGDVQRQAHPFQLAHGGIDILDERAISPGPAFHRW